MSNEYAWTITVADLRAALAGVPDDTPVVVSLPGGLGVFEGVGEALYRPRVTRQQTCLAIEPEIVRSG